MMLTKTALNTRTTEQFADALASMCKRLAIAEFRKLGTTCKPYITHPADDAVSRSILPMSEFIASLMNITGDTYLIDLIEQEYYKKGKTLQRLLSDIDARFLHEHYPRFGPLSHILLSSLSHRGVNLSGYKFSNDPMTNLAKSIRNEIAEARNLGINPDNYLAQIKMDVIQESYFGKFP